MVSNLKSLNPQDRIHLLYKHGRKLVGDRTANSRLNLTKVTESQYADDAEIYSTTRDTFEQTKISFVTIATKWRLTVSTERNKGLAASSHEAGQEAEAISIELDSGSVTR